jgi:hypothetical protein
MNITRADLTSTPAPELAYRDTYPSLGRTVLDSVLALGRATPATGMWAVVLLGAALTISFLVVGGLAMLGYNPAVHY